jgi:hypothetical protein
VVWPLHDLRTMGTRRLTREEECDRILMVCGADHPARVAKTLDMQFRILHNRAQVLLAICGVLLSTSVVLLTGKFFARPDSRDYVVAGLALTASFTEVAAAAFVVGGVLNVRWMTELPGADIRAWIMSSLEYRDSKTRAYRTSCALLLVAMLLFQIAAATAWIRT